MREIAEIGLPPIIFHYRNQKRALAAFAFDVRFTPESGHSSRQSECPLWGQKQTHALQQSSLYLIALAAVADISKARPHQLEHWTVALIPHLPSSSHMWQRCSP